MAKIKDRPQAVERVADPGCGMQVGTDSDYFSFYNGRTYYFCSPGDKAEFDRDPADYVLKVSVSTGEDRSGG